MTIPGVPLLTENRYNSLQDEFKNYMNDPLIKNFYHMDGPVHNLHNINFDFFYKDMYRSEVGFYDKPLEWHYANQLWPISDFNIQFYINLKLWNISPFNWQKQETDPILGLDEDKNAIRTLLVKVNIRNGVISWLKYCPEHRQQNVVLYYYYAAGNYGVGADRLYQIIREHYFRISIREVRDIIKKTVEWQLHNRLPGGSSQNHVVNFPQLIKGAAHRIQLDTINFKKGAQTLHTNCALTMIDCFSRKAWVWTTFGRKKENRGTIKSRVAWEKAGNTIKKLAERATSEGHSLVIQTDEGSEFEKHFSEGIRELQNQDYSIFRQKPVSHHHHITGAIEAFNKTIKNKIYTWITSRGGVRQDWDRPEILKVILESYNNTVHSATGYTPHELHHAEKDSTMEKKARHSVKKRAKKWVRRTNRGLTDGQLSITEGDFVRRRLNIRVTQQMATAADKHTLFSESPSGIKYQPHSFFQHWTRQIYLVVKVFQDSKVRVRKVSIVKVPPYIGLAKPDDGEAYEYVSNLFKIHDVTTSRAVYSPDLPNFEAPTTPRFKFPMSDRVGMPRADQKDFVKAGYDNNEILKARTWYLGKAAEIKEKNHEAYLEKKAKPPKKVVSDYPLRETKVVNYFPKKQSIRGPKPGPKPAPPTEDFGSSEEEDRFKLTKEEDEEVRLRDPEEEEEEPPKTKEPEIQLQKPKHVSWSKRRKVREPEPEPTYEELSEEDEIVEVREMDPIQSKEDVVKELREFYGPNTKKPTKPITPGTLEKFIKEHQENAKTSGKPKAKPVEEEPEVSSEEEEVIEVSSEEEEPFTITDVEGDGNCWFRSVALQFNKIKFKGRTDWTWEDIKMITRGTLVSATDYEVWADFHDMEILSEKEKIVYAVLNLNDKALDYQFMFNEGVGLYVTKDYNEIQIGRAHV
jgi:hypothetical protein